MELELTRSQLVRWRTAVFAIFLASGLSIATWASRVPAIKVTLGVDNIQIGLLLLGAGASSIIGVFMAPVILARIGAKRGMFWAMIIFAAGVAVIGIGTDVAHSYGLVFAGLVAVRLRQRLARRDDERRGRGDREAVRQDDHAAVPRVLQLRHRDRRRHRLPRGRVGTRTSSPTRAFMTVAHPRDRVRRASRTSRRARSRWTRSTTADRKSWRERLHVAMSAWREPRTYALGLIILGMAFAEGGANDWLALGIVEGHGARRGARRRGPRGLLGEHDGGPHGRRPARRPVRPRRHAARARGDRHRSVFCCSSSRPTSRSSSSAPRCGAPGVSLGFPLGMSAAADDPAKAAARVSAAATIGYIAFLCGPPILGFISEHIGLLNTLFILVGLVRRLGSRLRGGQADRRLDRRRRPPRRASRIAAARHPVRRSS